MSLHIRQIDPQDTKIARRWDSACHALGGSIYFRSAWTGVFQRAYGIKTLFLAAETGGGLAAMLPLAIVPGPLSRGLVSLPYVYEGGFLGNQDHFPALLNHAQRLARNAGLGPLTIRQKNPLDEALTRGLHQDLSNAHYVLSLAPKEEQTLARLRHSGRKQVNKCLNHGFETRFGPEQLKVFYHLYVLRMRQLGTPCHSLKFWRSMLDGFPGQSGVLTVFLKDQPAAGMIFLHAGDTFHDVLAISLPNFRQQGAYYFLHWQAVRRAMELGMREFDFERSQISSGTAWFKTQWGAVERPLHYYSENTWSLADTKDRYRHGTALWKRLPLSATRVLGPLLRRSIPGTKPNASPWFAEINQQPVTWPTG